MTLAEAQKFSHLFPVLDDFEMDLPQKTAFAKGFLEGYNSKEALQRKEVLDLVEALEKIIKFNDRAGVASWADEALSQYREATKP